jgi:hypothetical protein
MGDIRFSGVGCRAMSWFYHFSSTRGNFLGKNLRNPGIARHPTPHGYFQGVAG